MIHSTSYRMNESCIIILLCKCYAGKPRGRRRVRGSRGRGRRPSASIRTYRNVHSTPLPADNAHPDSSSSSSDDGIIEIVICDNYGVSHIHVIYIPLYKYTLVMFAMSTFQTTLKVKHRLQETSPMARQLKCCNVQQTKTIPPYPHYLTALMIHQKVGLTCELSSWRFLFFCLWKHLLRFTECTKK